MTKRLLLLLTFLFSHVCTYAADTVITSGYLDLSGQDVSRKIQLSGEWAFYDDILSATPWEEADPQYLTVPGNWDSVKDEHFGVATYHLKVNIGSYDNLLALNMVDNIQALKIYVDGKLIHKTGVISRDRKTAKPGLNSRPVTFKPKGDVFDLVIQVSNWDHRQSGLSKEIYFGAVGPITETYSIKAAIDILIIGMAFTFFITYLAFYSCRPKDKKALWFALLCLVLGLRTGLTNTSQLELLLGEGIVGIAKRMEYLAFVWAVIFFVYYQETLHHKYRLKWFSWVAPIPMYFFSLVIIFTPMSVHSFTIPFLQGYALLFVFYLFYFFYWGAKHPNATYYRLLGESLFMMASLIFDTLYYNNIILSKGPIAGYSLFIYIFIEGFYQAKQHAKVINRMEDLTVRYRKSIEEISQRRLEIEQQNKQLNWLALYDQLTGLPNRYNLLEVLKIELSRSERNNTKLAVLYMDFDSFKNINDTLGHNIGDKFLRLMADRLKGVIRKTDSLFRLGGDEFALVYNDLVEKEDINSIVKKIQAILEIPISLNDQPVETTASLGIAFYPDDGDNMNTLIKNSELAMYQAKEKSGNSFFFFNETLKNTLQSRINMSQRMKLALEAGHYKLYYQAQIDGDTELLVGFEALIRWIDPKEGMISPGEFIPIAEENGFIGQIGRWTLEEACRQIKTWTAQGYRDFTIAVNISAFQFGLDHFIFDFQEILEASKIDPSYLKVELTETMLMANPHRAQRKMEQIKAMGVKIALDDFGTGYSSLSYLNIFPVDYLKIDQAFIRDIHKNEFNQKLTTSIISLGKSLNLELIAEGVETNEEKAFVLAHGCSIIQGYIYSKPSLPHLVESFFPTP